MKKIMKNIAAATFAVAALAAPFAARAAADGDIFEIRPVDENGAAIANPTAPLDGGDVARFTVRLARKSSTSDLFRLVHTGINSEAVDWLSNRPAIGIYVNGVFKLAYLEKSPTARNANFTDFIFSYTVKPGDFAMPIRLAGSDKALVTDTTQPPDGYYLNFLDSSLGMAAWKVDDPDGNIAKFEYRTAGGYIPLYPESDGRRSDYDLSLCEFNVKTVDFDANDESATYWRTFHEHSTESQPVGSIPSLVVSGMPTNSVTLYVWSESEGAAVLIEGRDVAKVTTRSVHVDQSTTESRQVAEIKVVAGKQAYEFNVRGVAQGNDATIIMSAFPDFNYNAGTGARLNDYLTRKVRCVEPMPASVTIKPGKQAVTATSAYTTYATELNVALSENPVGHDFDVEVVPAFTDTSCPNSWWDYFRLAASTDADPTLTTPNGNPTLHFPSGSTMPSSITIPTASGNVTTPVSDGKIYLFALRSDEYVTGVKKITFAVTTTDATALKPSSAGGIDGWNAAQSTLTIDAENPVVVSMFDGTDAATAVAGAERTLQIVISDVYADMHSDVGYQIWIEKNTDFDTQFTQIPGLYKPGKGNVLYKVGTTDTLPSVQYSEPGVNKSVLYVVSPITGNQSANHNFQIDVTTPAGYTVETTTGETEFNEGDDVQVKITLDKQNTLGDIYAYLMGDTDADTAAVDCTWKAAAGGKGVRLANYATTISSGCKFVMLDGNATKTGSQYNYSVVFLTQGTWTDDLDKRVTAYRDKSGLTLTTRNVIPSIETVTMGLYDISESGATVGGDTNPAKFPLGISQTFTVAVDEPGELDKEPVDPGDRKFQMRWKFTDESGTTYEPTSPATVSPDSGIVEGNPDDTEYKFNFPSAGKWTVRVDMRDKDMGNKWGDGVEGQSFVFYVHVIDKPTISVTTETPYNEQSCLDFGGEAKIDIGLDLNQCSFDMYVNLVIAPNTTGGTGTFLLQTSDDVVLQSDGSYNVRFRPRATTQTIFVQSMDGTADSRTTGFSITPTMVADPTHVVPNSGGKHPEEYYVGVPATRVLVYNDPPLLDEEFDVYPVPTTNAIPASIGAADEAIVWSFDDVALDFSRGITVEFKGGGGWGPKTYTDRATAMADGAVGFVPSFGRSGPATVKLTVKDQDGGVKTVIWEYIVEASKSMKLVAHGPASGDVSKYNSAAGLGQGRVWAESKSAIAADSFSSTINCGLATSWSVYGYGYKVGDLDDGTNLHAPDGFGGYTTGYYADRDTPLNGIGANKGVSPAFAYVAPLDKNGNPVDSFLYAWMLKAASKEGGTSSFGFLNETISPEYVAVGRDSGKTVDLPTEVDDKGNYTETTLEAIFSIEYLASDNMGDINLDGIPDVYVSKYGFGQVDTEAGTASGTDVAKLDAFNDDGDYLPVGETSVYGTLIPGIAETWSVVGSPFKAKLEIRGNGDALNDAPANNPATRVADLLPDRVYTDPRTDSLSTLDGFDGSMPVEYLAWLDFAAANGLDPTDKANWTLWSPERPTNPTEVDTDGDEFPDGYEYFIWYRAHVGYNDGGVHRYLTGRAYDPRNPGEGKFIPAEVVAATFDPVEANGAFSQNLDTDNDGLPDLVEFAIGTNPVDFDTDGDGLPDGFEILLAGTDPLEAFSTRSVSDAMRNYDGDAMAYSSPAFEAKYVLPVPKHVKALAKFALVDANGDTDGVQWYVMPADDVPTDTLVYADSLVGGYVVKAGGVEYITTDKPAVVTAGAIRLAADLPPETTWTSGVFTNTDSSVKTVRLMPTRLVAGTRLDEAPDTSTTTSFGFVTFSADVKDSMTAWPYGRAVNTATTGSNLANIGGFGFLAIGRYQDAPYGKPLAALPEEDDTIAYLHHQVYQEFGFDPRTAWNANTPLGVRWGKSDSGSEEGEAMANNVNAEFPYVGIATRTREYTLYDEFLVLSFFLNGQPSASAMEVRPSAANPWYTIWSRYTTNGRGPNEAATLRESEHYKGREAINGSPDENGADTDADGVPDGWELYVMSGPKRYDNKTKKYYFRSPAPYDDGFMSSFGPFVPSAKLASETDNNATDGEETAGGDNDGLTEYREFAGTDTTLYYAKYSTTVVRPEEDAKWLNKFFPTDPWDSDTDDDGITDKNEAAGSGERGKGHGFVYGAPADDGKLMTIPGGGLNPLTVDTDFDGLPDGWEWQFNGETIYSGADPTYVKVDGAAVGNPLEGLVDGMDGTVPDAYNVVNGSIEDDGSFGTSTLSRTDGSKEFAKVNRDYDRDGLENWQEYMAGTMRCWRYDDILTPWEIIPDELYWNAAGAFAPDYAAINARYGAPGEDVVDTSAADGGDGEFWYKTLVDRSSPIYNPRLLSNQVPGDHYLSRVDNGWDLVYRDDELGGSYYYFKDRIDDDSLTDLWAKPFLEASGKKGKFKTSPGRYISCSPLEYDSDHDGMDDYYELFHGMNPLLGASGVPLKEKEPCDIVYDAWHSEGGDTLFEAWNVDSMLANYWTFQTAVGNYYKTGVKPRGTGYDFEYYPWLNGLATADPDGDDVRNQVESVMAKMATKTWLHTDPTPLWMTDSNYARSLTRTNYRMPGRDLMAATPGTSFSYKGKTYEFADFDGWAPADPNKNLPDRFVEYQHDLWWMLYGDGEMNWMFSFEENEGYDSDHDAMSDSGEAEGKLRAASDPQDANSPNRRQAMYFQGPAKPSALQTPPEVVERYPVATERWPDETTFMTFTVEAWVFAETLADATVVERAIWCDPSKAGDEEFVRKNFQLGVKSGKWYAKYDANGTLANSVVEAYSEADAKAGEWHHIAATYDGASFTLYVDGEQAYTPVASTRQPEYGSSAVVLHRVASAVDTVNAHDVGDYRYAAEYALRTIVVGASLKTQSEGGIAEAFDVHNGAGWGYYNRFFKGYIDEVRIWDGARSVDDIRADYRSRRRYTRDVALANRSAFFGDWSRSGGRNRYMKDSGGDAFAFVPELCYLFTFDSVPGGGDEDITAKVPAGFDYYQPTFLGNPERGAAVLSRPLDWNVAWWKKVVYGDGSATSPGYKSVYSSDQWVQWVPNTVAHLPRFDGTTLDSFFWSENTCGGTNGTYYFVRTAEPASRWTQMSYNGVTRNAMYAAPGARHHLVCELDGITYVGVATNDFSYERFEQFRFTGRHALADGLDMLPLGGAFAKTCEVMWDDQGASTPWEITSNDSDFNGLPDSWEEYAVANYSPETEPLEWGTIVTWNGKRMTAGEAYRHDLAKGRSIDTNTSGDPEVSPTPNDKLKQIADEDASRTPDWWDDLYGVYGAGGTTDSDNDGLNNYVEYLVSEIFPFGTVLDPKKPMSDSKTLDYFRKVGKLYLGEMFTDHDQMEDHWERAQGSAAIDPSVWDAQRDGDEDGWSNFAELRSVDDQSTWVQLGTETNLYTITFDYNSNERSIFDATNTATIALTEWFTPDRGWVSEWVEAIGATKIRYTILGYKPVMGYGGHPMPKVDLTVYYNGTLLKEGEYAPLVVKAYSSDDMFVPDAIFMSQATYGVNRLTLHVPQYGKLMEGRCHFVAYIAPKSENSEGGRGGSSESEEESAGDYEAGMPFGVAMNVEVGWNSARASIDLSETSAITPRIKLWEADACDRASMFGSTALIPSPNPTAIDSQAVAVRVIRYQVNEISVSELGTQYSRILREATFNSAARDFLHEGDFVAGEDVFDIDWALFADEIVEAQLFKAQQAVFPITNATYIVAFGGGGEVPLGDQVDAYAMHPILVSRRFEKEHTPPTAVWENGDSVCHVAQPTFRWKIENEEPWASVFGTTYTAFRIVVTDLSGNEVYNSGYQRMPVANSSGVYSWTAPLYVNCPSPSGSHMVFKNLEDYKWQVFTYNSKFKKDDTEKPNNGGSVPQTFRMNVTELEESSFSTAVDVRYAGPAANLAGRVRVQAFKTPDFSGVPVAEAATNGSATVRLVGLARGTYFLRAYIDTDYDWTLDDWESWGYLSERDHASVTGTKAIFTPVSVTVGPEIKGETPRIIYIEDRDIDGDGFPDVWEAEQNGNVFDKEVVKPVTGSAEFIAVNTNLTASLTDCIPPDKMELLMQTLRLTIGGKYGASLLTGAPVSSFKTTSSGALRVDSAVVEDTVAITSLSVDRATGRVVLGVAAETDGGSIDPAVAALYSVERGAEVVVKVYHTETLAAEWQLVATLPVRITSGGVEIPMDLPDGLDMSSGFFKVEIE